MTELSAGSGIYSGTALDSQGILHVAVQQAHRRCGLEPNLAADG